MFGKSHHPQPSSKHMTLAQAVEHLTRPEAHDMDWSLCLRLSDSLQKSPPDAVEQTGRAVKHRIQEKKEHTGLLALQIMDSLIKNSYNSHSYFITKKYWKSMKDLVTDKKTPSAVRNQLAENLQVYEESFSTHETDGHTVLTEAYNEWQKKGIKFPLLDNKKSLSTFIPPTRQNQKQAFTGRSYQPPVHSSAKERNTELEKALTADDLIKTSREAVSLLLEVLGSWDPKQNIDDHTVAIEIFESCKKLLPQIQEFIQGGMISESKMLEMLGINDDFLRAKNMYENLKKGRNPHDQQEKPRKKKDESFPDFDLSPSSRFNTPIEPLSAPPRSPHATKYPKQPTMSDPFANNSQSSQPTLSDPFASNSSKPRPSESSFSDPFGPSNNTTSISYDPFDSSPHATKYSSQPTMSDPFANNSKPSQPTLSDPFASNSKPSFTDPFTPSNNHPNKVTGLESGLSAMSMSNQTSLSYDPFSSPQTPSSSQSYQPSFNSQPPSHNHHFPSSNQSYQPSFNPQPSYNHQTSSSNQPSFNSQPSFENRPVSASYDPFKSSDTKPSNNSNNYDPFAPSAPNNNSNHQSNSVHFNPWE